MKMKLDYEELNDIIKCYVQNTLGLPVADDVVFICESSDYDQSVSAELIISYEECNEDEDENEDVPKKKSSRGRWWQKLWKWWTRKP